MLIGTDWTRTENCKLLSSCFLFSDRFFHIFKRVPVSCTFIFSDTSFEKNEHFCEEYRHNFVVFWQNLVSTKEMQNSKVILLFELQRTTEFLDKPFAFHWKSNQILSIDCFHDLLCGVAKFDTSSNWWSTLLAYSIMAPVKTVGVVLFSVASHPQHPSFEKNC